jgi:uncharacterized protein (TIGR03435 family)
MTQKLSRTEDRIFSRRPPWQVWATVTVFCGIPVGLGGAAMRLQRPRPLMPMQVRGSDAVAARPQFEVASVRPTPLTPSGGGDGNGKGGGLLPCRRRYSEDAGRVDIQCWALSELLAEAFGLPGDRITGPDWLSFSAPWNAQRFSVSAKLPQGASVEQVPEMLQALLRDRFKLEFHRGTKEGPIYALLVAKSGLKMKPAAPGADARPAASDPAPDAPHQQSRMSNLNGIRVLETSTPNPDGSGLPGRMMTTPAMGTVRETPMSRGDGVRHWDAPSISSQGLADLLTIAVGNPPVRDMTGLTGRYQVDLDVSMAEFVAVIKSVPHDQADLAEALLKAGQEGLKKFGLQLERRKGLLETIVVDHIEKTPTEN